MERRRDNRPTHRGALCTIRCARGIRPRLPDRDLRVGCVVSLTSLRLTGLLALQADPVARVPVPCAECRRHHRHAASGANWGTLVIHTSSMECWASSPRPATRIVLVAWRRATAARACLWPGATDHVAVFVERDQVAARGREAARPDVDVVDDRRFGLDSAADADADALDR